MGRSARIPEALLSSRRVLEIVRMSALRQLKARYRGSFLGVLWSFANPVLMTVLYTTLFGTAFAAYYGGSMHRYVFSAFVGVVVVTFFLQGTTDALGSVVVNGGLLNKIAIDPEVFPIASIMANTFQQSVTTFPLIVLMAAYITHDPVRVVLAPIMLLGVVALVTGFGLILSTLFVFFRDISHLWGVIGFIFWMTSPVFYPAALVPARVRPWFDVNPIGLSIGALRDVSMGHGSIDFRLLLTCLAVSALFLAVGHIVFRATRAQFMDLL
jgi:ABC-2 type transport system permease protein/lipopolysaccharide transport system permease protein